MTDDAASAPPSLPKFASDARVCGNCKLWQPYTHDARGWVGPCRVNAQRGLIPPSAPSCDAFAPRGGVAPAPLVAPKSAPARAVRNIAPQVIRRGPDGAPLPQPGSAAVPLPAPATPPPAPVNRIPLDTPVDFGGELNMTREELMDLFREAAGENPAPPLAQKWEGGHIQLVPGKADVQGKELPIDAFFHKIVMVRDRLRTLEMKVNANPKLTDAEKVELQHYVTRVYGSLTSFNVLFRDKADQFVGAKGEE